MAKRRSGSNTVREIIKRTICEFGTEEKPVTESQLVLLVEADGLSRNSVSPALSNLVKVDRHFHRRKIANPDLDPNIMRPQKAFVMGYWHDSRYSNSEYSKERERANLTGRAKREPAPTMPPLPDLAPYAPSGGVNVAARDYRINPEIEISEEMVGTAIRTINLFIEQNQGKLILNLETGLLRAALAEVTVTHRPIGE